MSNSGNSTDNMAKQLVVKFLAAMEARDLPAARSCLAADFTMTFPGGERFDDLQQLIDWAKPRYSSVAKAFEHFDQVAGPNVAVVYCFGTLHGIWPDGTSFSGIRFIDRFEVVGGKLVAQQVWNDMGGQQARKT